MGFPKYISLTLLIFFAFIIPATNAQVTFRELPNYRMKSTDSTFFGINNFRKIISLNGEWQVYNAGDKDKNKVSIGIPSIFKGEGDFIFEKKFSLTQSEINNYRMRIVFLGLNYVADISVNNFIIYRQSGGEFPFEVELPRDILHSGKDNVLSVKLHYTLDAENTIPVKQSFLFPKSFGGIFRDVYIHLIPDISISTLNVSDKYDPSAKKAKISITSRIDNKYIKISQDSSSIPTDLSLQIKLKSPSGEDVYTSADYPFTVKQNKEKTISQSVEINSPDLWSPSDPKSYIIQVELWEGETLLDKTSRQLAIYSLVPGKESLSLNGSSIELSGVTYVPSFDDYGSMASYDQMEKDIKMIKDLGFNSVRFTKSIPHPYYLKLCEKYGLIAFIGLPLNNIPESLAEDPNFISRSRNYLSNFIKAYKKYSAVAAIGLGSSYLPEYPSHIALIKNLAALTKKETGDLTYASFSNLNIPEITGLDMYGVELINTPIVKISGNLKSLQQKLGKGRVFISSDTYTVYAGNTNGYVNKHSFEAQAKYIDDLINYSNDNFISGYFINTMFDYKGNYASLINGYSKSNLYRFGICGADRDISRLSYKVIFSELHNTEKVTIPIGSKHDDAPMSFIIFGLLLALLLGVLVNSGKKFREDTSRALLRPYNFFADVRDQRIMSGFHSTILGLIIAAVSGLIVANLLFYFRTDIVVDKILLAFGNKDLMKIATFLSWHPVFSLLWLTISFIIILLLITAVIKSAAFFVRNRVFYSSVYFTVIWSFLPMLLLIPVGIILYRILNTDAANFYIYLGLVLFGLWAFHRLLKGIYVIFDVNPGSVYFYSIITVLLIFIIIMLYFQIKNSTIDYIRFTLKQYNILG